MGADGDTDYPGMEFHAALVTFLYAEGQWVIAWVAPWCACEAEFPRFDSGWVDESRSDSCLEDDGVNVGSLVAVKDSYEFHLLCFAAAGICGFDAWPVEASDGGEPYGAGLSERSVACP